MEPVEVYTAMWCHIDRLNGTNLRDGEKLRIRWPDGTVEERHIFVKRSSYEGSDMGHPCTIPVSEAFVVLKYHGKEVTVPIAGLEAERV